MHPIVTLEGIDQAISNLNYKNVKSLKYRLIKAIRASYVNKTSPGSIREIDTYELVKILWEVGEDISIIKNKRKNFSSLKSSINVDLKNLYGDGKNSEGIIIGPSNTFDMCEEAKSEILETFTYSNKEGSPIPPDKLTEVLKIVNDNLKNQPSDNERKDPDRIAKFDQIKELVQSISEKIGIFAVAQMKKDYGGDASVGGEMTLQNSGEEPEENKYDEEYDLEEPEAEEELIEELVPEDEITLLEDEDEMEEVDLEEEPEVEDELIEELEPEDETAVLEDEEDLEEVDPGEELDAEEEMIEVLEKAEEMGPEKMVNEPYFQDFSLEEILKEYGDAGYEGKEGIEKARLLSEGFNYALSAMDRYYNQYILIPEGEYLAGSKNNASNSKQARKVKRKSFYFGKFPVTNALFEVFIEKTGYVTTAERLGHGTVYYGRYKKSVDNKTGLETFSWNSALKSKIIEGACWYQPFGPGSTLHNKRNHPVVQVSLEDAIAFAAWTGKRLPTEGEWEAASRTAEGYEYPWGEMPSKGACNIEEACIGDTTPVDEYSENMNSFGVKDTIGNVMEWTMGKAEHKAGEKSGDVRYIVKGGSWTSDTSLCLSSRFYSRPEFTSNTIGFRCVAY